MILIVEDDAFIREMAELMIQDLGHRTLSAGDAQEGLVILRSAQHIKALFTDINLKADAFGGCELARQGIELRPKLPVLYTTGNLVTEKIRSLLVKGALLLIKPYTQRQLQVSIDATLAA